MNSEVMYSESNSNFLCNICILCLINDKLKNVSYIKYYFIKNTDSCEIYINRYNIYIYITTKTNKTINKYHDNTQLYLYHKVLY